MLARPGGRLRSYDRSYTGSRGGTGSASESEASRSKWAPSLAAAATTATGRTAGRIRVPVKGVPVGPTAASAGLRGHANRDRGKGNGVVQLASACERGRHRPVGVRSFAGGAFIPTSVWLITPASASGHGGTVYRSSYETGLRRVFQRDLWLLQRAPAGVLRYAPELLTTTAGRSETRDGATGPRSLRTVLPATPSATLCNSVVIQTTRSMPPQDTHHKSGATKPHHRRSGQRRSRSEAEWQPLAYSLPCGDARAVTTCSSSPEQGRHHPRQLLHGLMDNNDPGLRPGCKKSQRAA